MRFTYHGVELDGFDHPHNTTILNERAVELAVAMRWLQGVTGPGLEVGDVLSHYGVHGHQVVDKYDQRDGVENIDVMAVAGSYRWIVSISTLEHVGRDGDEPRDMMAAIRALEHLRSLIAPAGSMLVTIPGGYHRALDGYLRCAGGKATRDCTIVRDGVSWRQTTQRAFLPYGASSLWAESVWIGEFDGEDDDRVQAQLRRDP